MSLYPGQVVSLGDAKHGATVLLDDGTEAALQWLKRDHTRAKVRQHGRHHMIDATRIVTVLRRGDEVSS